MIDGVEVIDFHGHTGAWEFYNMGDDLPRQLHAMDAAGVDRSCRFNIFHIRPHQAHNELAQTVAASEGRLIGFAYASPLNPEMVAETRRAIDVLGFCAIKIYPPTGDITLTDVRWKPLFDFANARELAIISHTGVERSCSPSMFNEIAPQYPKVKFVIGHSGNVHPHRGHAIEAARAHDNVFLETCSTNRQTRFIEDLVQGAGAEKVLFGSDVPLMDPRVQIGKILCASISDEQKRMVLGTNARRLLKL